MCMSDFGFFFFFSSRRRHTRFDCDWSSDVCSSDLTTVAVRNAQLYAQVPLVDALGALAAKRRAWMQLPRRRQQVYVAATLVTVAALTLVQWPLRVSGTAPAFRPAGYAEARTLVPGIIERVLVREGTPGARGAPLVQLRDVEQRAARE